MKRFLLGVVATILLTLGAGSFPASAATNNFTITDYKVDYQLGRDSDNRSTLKTVETITADFPQTNQNHGLERALPLRYNDHSTSLKIVSITDASGARLDYGTNDQSGNRIVRIGDADTYVHGLQTYVITYTQRDITRFYGDTNKDEFYWDIVGTQWSVPINQLRATITLDSNLQSALGESACYRGVHGASDPCEFTVDAASLSLGADALAPREGVTVAMGFTEGTFAAYEQSAFERALAVAGVVWIIGFIILSPIAIILFVLALRRWYRVRDRRKEMGAIVTEYLPPKEYSVLVSSQIEGVAGKEFAAQLIDFAVRHYVKIYQVKEASTFSMAEYEIELIKAIDDLRDEEQLLLKRLFPSFAVGSRFAMSTLRNDSSLGLLVREAVTSFDVSGNVQGLRHQDVAQLRWFKRMSVWMSVVGVLFLSPVVLMLGLTLFFIGRSLRPLTDEGLALRRYLLGLKQYIAVAEVDRLRMLQSPEGADKVGAAVDGSDQAQLVKLYERVLPYAILFNQEKEWNKQLGLHYESASQQPDWYQGSGVFNAAVFGAAIGSFSSSAASNYSTSSSSSSGGSGGGGFSGGGGGGGGGGGW